MKNNNNYLKGISKNVGGDSESNKPNNHYLKEIAENTGSTIPEGHHSDNYYLKRIEENTEGGTGDCQRFIERIHELEDTVSDLEDELEEAVDARDNNVTLIDMDKLCPTDENIELIAIVTANGEKQQNVKVEFYEEESE